MLTFGFGATKRNHEWNQHVRLFQLRRALPPDERDLIANTAAHSTKVAGSGGQSDPWNSAAVRDYWLLRNRIAPARSQRNPAPQDGRSGVGVRNTSLRGSVTVCRPEKPASGHASTLN